MDTSIDKIYY